jgi:nicotinate-nucleotide adenylyltransferase
MRLGLLGGTFDPPHLGHVVAAVQVCAARQLDAVHLIVANVPWQKIDERDISEVRHRVAMTALAAGCDERLVASTVEVELGGDSVTAATVEHYRDRWPSAELSLVVGSDAAAGMATWRRYEELAAMIDIVVLDRPGREGGRPPAPFRFEAVECPLLEVSSTYLRDRVTRNEPIDWLVPPAVHDYIRRHSLYGADQWP